MYQNKSWLVLLIEGYTLHACGNTCRVESTGSGGRGLLGAAGRAPVGWTYSCRCSHVTEKSKRWVRRLLCHFTQITGNHSIPPWFSLDHKMNFSETRLYHRPCTAQMIPLIHPCKGLVETGRDKTHAKYAHVGQRLFHSTVLSFN